MKNFVLVLVAMVFLSASGFAQSDEKPQKEIAQLEKALEDLRDLEKDLGKFWPIIQELKESDADYFARAGRMLKGRALFIHLLDQCMFQALTAKFRLEIGGGEKAKKFLEDPRVAALEKKAEGLSELASVASEGLELVGAKEFNSKLRLARHEDKAFRAYQKYKFAPRK
ncbi:MAG: hypothetical protein Q7S10_03805 [bacterium]|nr:hypothetical protein [bacterium]